MLNAETPAGAISRCSIDIKRRLSAPSVAPPIFSWRTIDLMLQKRTIHNVSGARLPRCHTPKAELSSSTAYSLSRLIGWPFRFWAN